MAFVSPKNKLLADILSDDTSFATEYVAIVVDTFGVEALGWDPETLRLELLDEFDIPLSEVGRDKLFAASTLVTTDSFWTSLSSFLILCNCLSAPPAVDFTEFDPVEPEEFCWGLVEALTFELPARTVLTPAFGLRGRVDDVWAIVPRMNEEIRAYCRETLASKGIDMLPGVLGELIGDPEPKEGLLAEGGDPMMDEALLKQHRASSDELIGYTRRRYADLLQRLSRLQNLLKDRRAA